MSDARPATSETTTAAVPNTAPQIQRWCETDVLVALPQTPFVLDLLFEAGVEDVRVDADEGLDLARLSLGDPEAAAEAVTRLAAGAAGPADQIPGVPGVPGAFGAPRAGTGAPEDVLDALLRGLRAVSAARYGGWEPRLGKNRLVDRVGGVNGIVIHGDDLGPATTDGTLAARAAGGGRGVTVGVIDGPVSEHPWFAGAVQFGYADDVSAAMVPPSDPTGANGANGVPGTSAGHATFVAGLILQQAPSATVRARAVLAADGTADVWNVARQIVALGNSGVDVLNLSFGCFTADDRAPMALHQAVSRVDPRVVIVAAAGNYATDSPLRRRPFWPAALPHVVAVGALSRRNGALTRAPFSPALPWVDVEAVGVDALSTYLEAARLADGSTADFDGWARWQGTSFAAAAISGMIARAIVPGRVDARAACADLMAVLRTGAEPRGARLCRPQAV